MVLNLQSSHREVAPPNLGGCEEDLSHERRGILHRGQTDRRTHIHTYTQTDIATQWADSVKASLGYGSLKMANNLSHLCMDRRGV